MLLGLVQAIKKLNLERAKYEGTTEGELDRIVKDNPFASMVGHQRGLRGCDRLQI
jgi:hypothetical protein